jgi:hypothetical protein
MATISEARALPFFADLYGSPLESGSIYIGQPGLDPIAYPITVFSDSARTAALAQPIRTVHGRAVSGGSQVHMFCPIPYSITVLDAAGRVVYASLNETDASAAALATSTIQSVLTFDELRARDKNSTQRVWVNNCGMYVYVATDTISPENVPLIIVGKDGGRYYLNVQNMLGGFVKVASVSPATTQGGWLSWEAGGTTFLTNNKGAGVGGVVLRNVSSDGGTELGRVTMTPTGGLLATDSIATQTGDISSAGSLSALGGTVSLNNTATRKLQYDGTQYNLPGAPLSVNGSLAVTAASQLANQLANGVGSVALGDGTGPTPVPSGPSLPGTWQKTGSANSSVFLWVRVA